MLDDKNAVLAVRPARGEKLGVRVRRGHPDGAVEGVETFRRMPREGSGRAAPHRRLPERAPRFLEVFACRGSETTPVNIKGWERRR